MDKLSAAFAWVKAKPGYAIAIVMAIIILLSLVNGANAQGQRNCGPYDGAIAMLTERFGEAAIAMGVVNEGSAVMELFVSPESGTWTVMLHDGNGMACIVAFGDGFEAMTAPVAQPSGVLN